MSADLSRQLICRSSLNNFFVKLVELSYKSKCSIWLCFTVRYRRMGFQLWIVFASNQFIYHSDDEHHDLTGYFPFNWLVHWFKIDNWQERAFSSSGVGREMFDNDIGQWQKVNNCKMLLPTYQWLVETHEIILSDNHNHCVIRVWNPIEMSLLDRN